MGFLEKQANSVIVLVVEGAYPYRKGGLSNWIQDFMRGMETYQFYLVTIVDRRETCGTFVYDLPSNVVGLQELILEGENLEELSPQWALGSDPSQWLTEILDADVWDVASSRWALQTPQLFSQLFQWIKYNYPQAPFLPLYRQIRSLFGNLLGLLAQVKLPAEACCIHALSTGYAGYVAAYLSRRLACPLVLSEHGLYLLEKEEVLSRSPQLV